jgi:Cd2+/Zn2+-exporting ATPase
MSDTCCGGACAAPVAAPPADLHGHDHGSAHDTARLDAWRIGLAGALVAVGMAAGRAGHPVWHIAASLAAIALTVPGPARRAWAAARRASLDIDVLMIIAVVGAAALGDWTEAAAVVWLFDIAQWLEAKSLARATRAIGALVTIAPRVATVRRGTDAAEREVPVDSVVPGDIVIVRPGQRIPVDGTVRAGESAVDQAPVTGESWPVDKAPGDTVLAGTINGTGAMEIAADRPASDSTLARIIHLVQHAQEQRAPVQRFVDRFARVYTPAVVVAALLTVLLPTLVAVWSGAVWTTAFALWSYRALALLVVACPCALVISTPVAIVSALTAAARAGVLIKGGAHLERLGSIRCVALDKTGTLTDGHVVVSDVFAVEGATSHRVLSVAAALESRSEHPIGRAIVNRARADGLAFAPGDAFRALPGLGAEAVVAAAPAVVGSHRLFETRQLCTPSLHARIDEVEEHGAVPVLVGHGGAALGVIGLTDGLRGNGRGAIEGLRDEGVAHIVLLTGDRETAAASARAGAGLDAAHAELLPDEKVKHVARLRAEYGPVAMVGDGINDAPALAAADVGIAMGVAGTDAALETADVALMADDLSKIPYALRLGRRTVANIRENVAIALGLKLLFGVLAVAGVATLWMAILADTGASLLVTANSLRLLRVKSVDQVRSSKPDARS